VEILHRRSRPWRIRVLERCQAVPSAKPSEHPTGCSESRFRQPLFTTASRLISSFHGLSRGLIPRSGLRRTTTPICMCAA